MKYRFDWILPDDLQTMLAENGMTELPVGTDLTYKGERFLVTNSHGGLRYTLAEWSAECEFYARRLTPYTPAPPVPYKAPSVAETMDQELRQPLEELLSRVLHLNPDCHEVGAGMLAQLQGLAARIATHLQGAAWESESGCDCECECDS